METKKNNIIAILLSFILSLIITSWLNAIFNNYSISPLSVVYFLTVLIGVNYLIHHLLPWNSKQLLKVGLVIILTIIEELALLLIYLLQTNLLILPDTKAIVLLFLINLIIVFRFTSQQKPSYWQLLFAIVLAIIETVAIWLNFDAAMNLWSWLLVIGSLNLLINLIGLDQVKLYKYWLLSAIAGVLFSLALVLGKTLYESYQFPVLNSATIWKLLGFFVLWTVVVALIMNFVIQSSTLFHKSSPSKIQNWFNHLSHPWLFSSILAFVIFIPAIIALAPGIWSYDTPFQYFAMTKNVWNIDQPIISMMVVYFFVQIIGVQLLHSLTIGLFILILVQFGLAALIFGYGFNVLNRWRLPWFIQAIVWGWWTLHITNWTSLAQSNTKDTWTGLAATIIMIFLLEIVYDRQKFFHNYTKLIILIIALFMFLTFRNSSRLVLLLFLPFFICLCWKCWKQVLTIVIATIALFYLFNDQIVHNLSMGTSTVQHVVASTGQQAESVRNLNNVGNLKAQIIFGGYIVAGHQFSNSDKKLLWTIIPKGTQEQYSRIYSPQFADVAANVWGQLGNHYSYIYRGNFTQRSSQMMRRIILHHPKAALQVILNQNLGWYYPQSIYPSKSGNIYNEVINETKNGLMKKDGVIITNWNWWPSLYKFTYSLEQDGNYWHYPVIASLFDPAFWSWLMLLIILILIAQKSWSTLIVSAFVLIQWLTLWAAPVVLVRYIYPVFLCLPLMFTMVYLKQSKSISNYYK